MGGRILMVAYHFPPSGAVAAQRPSKFARYLPEFGWTPFVLARRPDPRQPEDTSFDGRPSAGVRRTPLEPERLLGALPAGWRNRARRFFFIPDEELGWMASVAARLPGLIRRFRPDVLWANSVPTGSLVAAAWTARRMRVPLVLDFHNEWIRNMYYRPATPLHDRAHRALEGFVVRTARLVVTLNPAHTEDLRRRFPGTACETVENGFDPEDYEVRERPAGAPRVFTYAGAVYGYQSPAPFLRALAATGRRDVSVRIVGDRFGAFEPGAWPFPVRVEGHVPHRELGSVLSESAAFFLCLEPPAARQLPAKMYEYLRAGRPVFAIAPRGGAVEQWLSATGAGVCVPSEEPERAPAALRDFIERLDRFCAVDGRRFQRRDLAARLASFLDEVHKAGRIPG